MSIYAWNDLPLGFASFCFVLLMKDGFLCPIGSLHLQVNYMFRR